MPKNYSTLGRNKMAAKKAPAKKAPSKKVPSPSKAKSKSKISEKNPASFEYTVTDGGDNTYLTRGVPSNTNAKGYVKGGHSGRSAMLSKAKKTAWTNKQRNKKK